MKLVADIDTIISNATPLNSSVEEFAATVNSLAGASASFEDSEVNSIINGYVKEIATDLGKIDTSCTEYVTLIDECCQAYQTNEANTMEVDISNVLTISLNDSEISGYEGSAKEKLTAIDTSTITSNSSTKNIDLSQVKSGSNVAKALAKYGSELDNATYAKVNGNIFMTITPTTVNGKKCYVSHVVVNNPNQIFGEPANGSYASGLETASSAAKRTGASLVINGSHFLYSNGAEDNTVGTNNIVIAQGDIKANGYAQNMEICLDKNGRLFTSNKSAEELKNEGVVYTFASHGAPMIENGSISPVCSQETRIYNRTVIGMIEPCDYLVVTDIDTQSQTATANYMLSRGCTFAKSLDQGGSVSLVYDGNLVNTPRDGSERAVGDFICFNA